MYIVIDKKYPTPLSQQLYQGFRERILEGRLIANEKLPSTRLLSEELNVSRSTVIACYDQLMAEGYIYGVEGSGTYVSEGIAYHTNTQHQKKDITEEGGLYPKRSGEISFRAGVPDLSAIPITKWGQLYRQVTQDVLPDQMDYHNEFGVWSLRVAMMSYLERVRGVKTTPSNIIITSGAAQAFSMLCRLISDTSFAVMENPVSKGLYETLQHHNVRMAFTSVDKHGIMTDQLPSHSPSLIFTTPSHQFPTGVVMSIKRRIELIDYARKHQAYIVEDDYDSEFRYLGNPIQAMQHLADDCVIYVGSFSKLLSPAIRLGYMVLPDSLVLKMRQIKYSADLHSPIFEQLTMARFIQEGLLDKHIAKMRKLYSKRRLYLIEKLREAFGQRVSIDGDGAGLHMIVTFDVATMTAGNIEDLGIYLLPIEVFRNPFIARQQAPGPNGFSYVMGFGNTDKQQIDEGIRRLKCLVPLDSRFVL